MKESPSSGSEHRKSNYYFKANIQKLSAYNDRSAHRATKGTWLVSVALINQPVRLTCNRKANFKQILLCTFRSSHQSLTNSGLYFKRTCLMARSNCGRYLQRFYYFAILFSSVMDEGSRQSFAGPECSWHFPSLIWARPGTLSKILSSFDGWGNFSCFVSVPINDFVQLSSCLETRLEVRREMLHGNRINGWEDVRVARASCCGAIRRQ